MTDQAKTADPRQNRLISAQLEVDQAEARVEETRRRADPICKAYAWSRERANWNPRQARTEDEQQALMQAHAVTTEAGRGWMQDHGAALLSLADAKASLKAAERAAHPKPEANGQ